MTRSYQGVVCSIREQASRSQLDREELKFFLAKARDRPGRCARDAVVVALQDILENGTVPENHEAFRTLVQDLRELLHFELPYEPFRSTATVAMQSLKRALFFAFVLFCAFVVLGGVASGESVLLSGYPAWISLGVLCGLLITLAVVEGLEVSVIGLQLRRLDAVEADYPRAYRAHSRLIKDGNVERFLSGRQVFVIMLVFLFAQLTTFPGMTKWPFTNSQFPTWMSPWFEVVFLRWGLLGAFLAVWIGQLAPKLIATRYPLAFLDIPAMGFVTRLALLVNALGLTLPSTWIADRLQTSMKQEFPYAKEEEYKKRVYDLGYDVLRFNVGIEFDGTGFSARSKETVVFHKRTRRYSHSLSLEGKVEQLRRLKPTVKLIKPNGEEGEVRVVSFDVERRAPEAGQVTVFWLVLERSHGNFQPGETLMITTEVSSPDYPADEHSGFAVQVLEPYRLLDLEVKFRGYYVVDIKAVAATRVGPDVVKDLEIIEEGDSALAHYVEWHPESYTTHKISWSCTRRV